MPHPLSAALILFYILYEIHEKKWKHSKLTNWKVKTEKLSHEALDPTQDAKRQQPIKRMRVQEGTPTSTSDDEGEGKTRT